MKAVSAMMTVVITIFAVVQLMLVPIFLAIVLRMFSMNAQQNMMPLNVVPIQNVAMQIISVRLL